MLFRGQYASPSSMDPRTKDKEYEFYVFFVVNLAKVSHKCRLVYVSCGDNASLWRHCSNHVYMFAKI